MNILYESISPLLTEIYYQLKILHHSLIVTFVFTIDELIIPLGKVAILF